MDTHGPNQQPPAPPPMSTLEGAVGDLIRSGTLAQPPNPGLAAALDGFGILKPLDQGASAWVFLAIRLGTNERVAIKMLKPDLAQHPDLAGHFVYSARTTQEKLNHPNIVPVLEVHDAPEGPYLVMPYYAPGSLRQLIEPATPLPNPVVLSVARDVAAALEHIHEQGLIHRDVKPANILLDDAGRAHLADFGLARTLFNDPVMDTGGHGAGTAPYMSPAVAAGKAEDTRCDIYSFGAVLYHLLTGHPPYTGNTTEEIRTRILAEPPRPVRKANPKAAPGLAAVCEGAMAREVRDRYASMGDVIEDLERVDSRQTPHGPHGHHQRRRRLEFVIAVTLLGALAGVGLWRFRPRTHDLTPVQRLTVDGIDHWQTGYLGHWQGRNRTEFCLAQANSLQVFGFNRDKAVAPQTAHRVGSMPGTGLTVETLAAWRLGTSSPEPPRLLGFADVTGEPGSSGVAPEEILVTSADGDTVCLTAYGQLGAPVLQYRLPGTVYTDKITGQPRNTGILGEALTLTRLDPDGPRLLLVDVSTGWGLNPRGLACFALDTTQLLWTNWIAGIPAGVAVLDLEADGRIDLLLGSYSVNNGNKLPNGTSDSNCYLYALDHNGQTKWTRELGGPFTWCRPLAVRTAPNASPQPYAWLGAEEHTRGSPLLFPSEIIDLPALARNLANRESTLSTFLSDRLSVDVRQGLTHQTQTNAGSAPFRTRLAQDLNRLLGGESFHAPDRFEETALSEETRRLLDRKPTGAGLLRLNRLLLEESYPDAIQKLQRRCERKRDAAGQWTDALPVEPGVGKVIRLDAQGRTLAQYDAGAALSSCLPIDLDGDGTDELLATDSWGYLHVLTPDLSLLNKRLLTTNVFTTVDLRLVALTNLLAGRARHLVLTSSQRELLHGGNPGDSKTNRLTLARHHNEIIVLDPQLRPVSRLEIAEEWGDGYDSNWLRAADLDGDRVAELVALTGALTVYKLR